MLYTSTRDKHDSFTAGRTLSRNRPENGGFFVPTQLPVYSREELDAFRDQTEPEVLAQILNDLLGTEITGRDIEFLLGQAFYGLHRMNHRIVVAELWKNPDGVFDRTVKLLAVCLGADREQEKPSVWAEIAVRIAGLFAVFSRLSSQEEENARVDLAVLTENFYDPMAAWYARNMGLPIGCIICCCNDNGGVWDLLRRGQIKTDAGILRTNTPECDIAMPEALEMLVYETLGPETALEFGTACEKGGIFELSPEQHQLLSRGMDAAVAGSRRVADIIPNVCSTADYIFCPYSALLYAGLMDYRTRSPENREAVLWNLRSPMLSAAAVCAAMGISEQELEARIKEM